MDNVKKLVCPVCKCKVYTFRQKDTIKRCKGHTELEILTA